MSKDFGFNLGRHKLYFDGGSLKKNVDFELKVTDKIKYKVTGALEVKPGSVRFSADFPVIGHKDISFGI